MAIVVPASSSPFKKRKLIIPTFMQKIVEVPIPMAQEEIVYMPNIIQQESITQQHDEIAHIQKEEKKQNKKKKKKKELEERMRLLEKKV